MYRITKSLTPDGLSFSAGSWLWVLWCLFPPLRSTSSGKLRELLRRWGYCFWIHMLSFVYHTRRGAGWPLWFWSLHHWPFRSLVAGRLLVGGAAKVFWLRNVSKFRQNLTRFVKASLKIALSVRAAILVSKEETARRRETKMAARNVSAILRKINRGLWTVYLFSIGSFWTN